MRSSTVLVRQQLVRRVLALSRRRQPSPHYVEPTVVGQADHRKPLLRQLKPENRCRR